MSDALSEFKFKESGGLFLTISKGDSVKIRVLTTDPLVTLNKKYGNTIFNFIVWNWDEGKAQVLSKGASIARPIQRIHTDEDYGADIQKVDLKLVATSTGPEDKDVEYSVNPLPKAENLTKEQLEEAKQIDLEKAVGGNGTRMSELNKGADLTPDVNDQDGVDDRRDDSGKDEVVLDDDEPADLSEIPF